MWLIRELLCSLPVAHGAATIKTGDAGGVSICMSLLQFDFQVPIRRMLYNLAGIASARHLQDMIDLVPLIHAQHLNELDCKSQYFLITDFETSSNIANNHTMPPRKKKLGVQL